MAPMKAMGSPRLQIILPLGFLAVFLFSGVVRSEEGTGFLFNIASKAADEIRKLSDDVLLNIYADVLIELEASTTFSRRGGFTPRDYQKYKKMLRYRFELLQEIKSRKLAVPETGQSCPLD